LIALPSFISPDERTKITILHTNDTHSRIDPFLPDDSKFPGLGGVNKRMSLIEKIRDQENMFCFLTPAIFFRERRILICMAAKLNSKQ